MLKKKLKNVWVGALLGKGEAVHDGGVFSSSRAKQFIAAKVRTFRKAKPVEIRVLEQDLPTGIGRLDHYALYSKVWKDPSLFKRRKQKKK